MGNTTIIELNHDKYREIEEHPELFIEQILEQLRTMNNDGGYIQGGSIVCSFNRNNGTLDREWQKFLLRVGKFIIGINKPDYYEV
jgi:hypothetical protein